MIQLRPHQVAAVDAVEQSFREGISRPLIDACVGAGKSLMYGELARREIARGGRVIIGAHTRELVEQNAAACRSLGLEVGINAAALNERCWRAPVISAAIQSVYKNGIAFGPISMLCTDEAHLVMPTESGMYRALHRALAYPRLVGGSGTIFRLQGGSLIEGKDAPFERVVYTYSILDGIRDGYLVPAYSAPALDKIDPSKLRIRQGEFTGESQDDQMLASIDNHIAQMVHFGEDRRGWLIFEASTKAARAMATRLTEWGVPTGLVLGTTPAGERTAIVEAYRAGRLRALVNVTALNVGFDVQHVDMLVMRRRTKSLGLYVQVTGRGLRTIGGNIEASIAAGKADCLVLDFAGNIDQHGPLDFIRPKSTKPSLTSCDACGTRNVSASKTCWSCGAALLKNCPACLMAIEKDQMTCPHCDYDMRTGPVEVKKSLSDRPSGSAIIAAYKSGSERVGGWLPIGQLWEHEGKIWARAGEAVSELGVDQRFRAARWLRSDPLAILVPHGSSRTIARQINIADGSELIVPMPQMC